MKVAYIIGAYRGKDIHAQVQNIMKAREKAIELWKAGYACICPHLNSAWFDGEVSSDDFLNGYLEILTRCDICFVLDNWKESAGSQVEIELAEKLGKVLVYE